MARKIYTALDLRGNTVANLTLGNYNSRLVAIPGSIRYNESKNRIEYFDPSLGDVGDWRSLSIIEKAVVDILLHKDDPSSSIVKDGVAYLDEALDSYAFKEGDFNNAFKAKNFQVGEGSELDLINISYRIIEETPYLIFTCPKNGNQIKIPFSRNVNDLTNLGGSYVTTDTNQDSINGNKTWKGEQKISSKLTVQSYASLDFDSAGVAGQIISIYNNAGLQLRFQSANQSNYPSYTAVLDLKTIPNRNGELRSIAFKDDPSFYYSELSSYTSGANRINISDPNQIRSWYYGLMNLKSDFTGVKSLKFLYKLSNGLGGSAQLIECNRYEVDGSFTLKIFFSNPLILSDITAIGIKHTFGGDVLINSDDWSSLLNWELIPGTSSDGINSGYPGNYYVDLEN